MFGASILNLLPCRSPGFRVSGQLGDEMASCFPALVEISRALESKYGIVRFLSLAEDLESEVVFMIKLAHLIPH